MNHYQQIVIAEIKFPANYLANQSQETFNLTLIGACLLKMYPSEIAFSTIWNPLWNTAMQTGLYQNQIIRYSV